MKQMNLKKFEIVDPKWRIQDGGHQNGRFISNMKFVCMISGIPKICIPKIYYRCPS